MLKDRAEIPTQGPRENSPKTLVASVTEIPIIAGGFSLHGEKIGNKIGKQGAD